LSLCPNCITGNRIPNKEKRNPLKMILFTRVGHRCQVDLIYMSFSENPVTGDNYILRFADHLSAGHVRPMKGRPSVTATTVKVEIIAQSLMSSMLQSDNGVIFLRVNFLFAFSFTTLLKCCLPFFCFMLVQIHQINSSVLSFYRIYKGQALASIVTRFHK